MNKQTPVLVDLFAQDESDPLVQIPTYPEPWTQPATVDLLIAASRWPVNVATAPYVGTAMIANTGGSARRALVRVAGSVDYLRVDATQCITNNTAGSSLTSNVEIEGTDDSTVIKLQLPWHQYTSWPTTLPPKYFNRSTTSAAIVESPSANQDRQLGVTQSKAAQTEAVTVKDCHAVTFWASNRVADLLDL